MQEHLITHKPTNAEILIDLAERLGEQRIADLIRREMATNATPRSPAPTRRSDRYLTVEEVAERLGASRDTVYRLLKSHRLAYVKLTGAHGSYRIRPEALETFRQASEILPVGTRRR